MRASTAVTILIWIYRSTIDTLPFLDFLWLEAVQHLLHRVDPIERIALAVNLRAAVLVISGDVSVHGTLFRSDDLFVFYLLLLFVLIFFHMLLFVLFHFFLVSLALLVVIILESVVYLGQDVRLEFVQVLLRNRTLGLWRVQRLRHWHSVEVRLSSNEVRGGKGFLEVGNLLLEDAVFAKQLRVLPLEMISLQSDTVEVPALLLKLLLQRLLVVLLSLTASDR